MADTLMLRILIFTLFPFDCGSDWRSLELWWTPLDQTSNPKHQALEKSQAPSPKSRMDTAELELEIWSFFGVCSLVFGA
jgi:hypothetical protein